jgi:hypothetical protein
VTIEPNDSSAQLQEMYRPPAADDVALPPSLEQASPFYVVSRTKFLVLFFVTLGGYQLYWFFSNWRRYRSRTLTHLLPLWRAIFSPLFAHRLFELIAQHGSPAVPRFAASSMATLYVVLMVASWIIDRVQDNLVLDVASIVLALLAVYPLLAAQEAANAAAGDPQGSSNSRMTALNYVFIVLGILLWSLVALGLLAPEE